MALEKACSVGDCDLDIVSIEARAIEHFPGGAERLALIDLAAQVSLLDPDEPHGGISAKFVLHRHDRRRSHRKNENGKRRHRRDEQVGR
jgi:hypothetical protein